MPITRSTENLNALDIDEPTNCSFTIDVNGANMGTPGRTRMATRSQTTRRENRADTGQSISQEARFRLMISESIESLRTEMTTVISNEIRAIGRNLNSGSRSSEDMTSVPPNIQRPVLPISGASDTDKILNIVRNWRIKFTGFTNNMTVDEFIYRVNILTTNNLGGDFELLCKHAHILFDGKALEWYWRYHRRHDEISWNSLTAALKTQYKEDYSDYDVLDDIRRRKQKANEGIDEYLEIISSMTDRLRSPLTDADLCETIVRNLRSEIRHELLHVQIGSIAQLRKEVRRHEKFMKDVQLKDMRNTRVRVAALDDLNDTALNDVVEEPAEVCGMNILKCWNCDGVGHTYVNCMGPRRVFCYGCGLRDVYKPSCPRCVRIKQGNGKADVHRRSVGHPEQ